MGLPLLMHRVQGDSTSAAILQDGLRIEGDSVLDLQAIMAVIAGAAGGSAVATAKVRAAREVARDLSAARGYVQHYRQARDHVRSAKRLLGFHQRDSVVYRSDNVHPLYAGQPSIHPDNWQALMAAAGDDYLSAEHAGILEVQDIVSAGLDDNLVLFGSPISEGISRLMFGYTPQPGTSESLILRAPPVDLPYRLVLNYDEVPEQALARRYVKGKGAVTRRNWRIETDRATYIPELGDDGWLRTDYLLVTRVRNFLTADGFAQGHSILSIGGTHGTGTRGLELLLRDKSILQLMGEATRDRDCPSFQVLLRVSHIDHNHQRGSQARRIELIEKPILIGDEPQRWQTAQRTVRQATTDWVNARS